MSEKNLATIQRIKTLESIEGADRIELAKLENLCWQVVVQKGIHNIGDSVVYIQIDTILPNGATWSQFLKNNEAPDEAIRLKTVKLRGTLSQGLILPLSAAFPDGCSYNVGNDVTEILDIKHYEKPVATNLSGQVKGNFPAFLRKTDEERIQNFPEVLNELYNFENEIVITLKMDGTSSTFFKHENEFGVCSRNLQLKESDENTYWKIAHEYDLINKLPDGICIQGELVGPGIQANKCGFDDVKLLVFNGWNINEQRYFNHDELQKLCDEIGVATVPVVYRGNFKSEWLSIDSLLTLADEQKYERTNKPAEGIVIRPVKEMNSTVLGGRLSFKVISNKFLLKNKE